MSIAVHLYENMYSIEQNKLLSVLISKHVMIDGFHLIFTYSVSLYNGS